MAFSNEIAQYLIERSRATRTPISVNFELLPVCNLNCRMCYIRSSWSEVNQKGGLIKKEQWIEMASQLKKAGTLFLLLTGGEVFLYPEFKELYIELYKMGFVLTINTNATLIEESDIEWLKEYPPKCVSISLYGSNNDVYENLCGRKNMFSKLDNILNLLKQNNINIELKTMLNPLNWDDLEEIYEYASKLDVPFETALYSFPACRKEDKLNKQIRFNARETAINTIKRNRIICNDEEFYSEIEKHLKKYEESKDIPGRIHKGFTCTACNTSCWILWNGHMTSCAIIDKPYTLPFDMGFLNAWEELKSEIDKITISTKCSYCDKREVCIVCPASAYAETGDIGGTSKFHCEMTDILLENLYNEMKRFKEKENEKA